MRSVSFVFVVFPLALTLWMVSGNVVLIGNNVTLSFDDIEANFSPPVQGSGECGVLHLAEPLDACSELTNKVVRVSNTSLPYVLIVRGGCSFEDKVRKAQKAGFKAAIVYNNEDNGVLVSMAGNSAGVKIHAVFVSGASGQILMNYAGLPDLEMWIIPSFGNSAWSIVAVSFISLLAMSAVLATCFFVRRHQIRRERPRASRIREFHGMSSRLVKEMPSQIFTSAVEDSCTSMTCAICLEDYSVGEKLRVLPCHHKFHAFCVDSWLMTRRTFCPVCKRDVRTTTGDPTASESTPLLSSSPASVASSALLSFRSSLASSSAIQILPVSLSFPRAHSLAGSPYAQQSLRSYRQSPSMRVSQSSVDLQNAASQRLSPSMSVSQSSVDLQNAASQRCHYSHLVSPHSSGYPSLIPSSSRYMSPYIRSPSYASASLISSSGYQLNPLRCSKSAASFSPFASAHSLPES